MKRGRTRWRPQAVFGDRRLCRQHLDSLVHASCRPGAWCNEENQTPQTPTSRYARSSASFSTTVLRTDSSKHSEVAAVKCSISASGNGETLLTFISHMTRPRRVVQDHRMCRRRCVRPKWQGVDRTVEESMAERGNGAGPGLRTCIAAGGSGHRRTCPLSITCRAGRCVRVAPARPASTREPADIHTERSVQMSMASPDT